MLPDTHVLAVPTGGLLPAALLLLRLAR